MKTTAIRSSLIVLALLTSSLGVTGGISSASHIRLQRDETVPGMDRPIDIRMDAQPAESASMCPQTAGDAGSGATPYPGPAVLDGMSQSLLAESAAATLPDAPAGLFLERTVIEPGKDSGSWQAVGPMLIYVASGTVTVIVNDEEQQRHRGESLLIEMDDNFALLNDEREPAAVLWLALGKDPLSEDGVGSSRIRFRQAAAEPQVLPGFDSETLFARSVRTLPAAPARLFLACVTWREATGAAHQHPGPVGMRIEDGWLRINGEIDFQPGDCAYLEPNMAYRAEPVTGEAVGSEAILPATALVFGVLPPDQPLRAPGTDTPADLGAAWGCGEW